jgi:hypothetical protein
VAKAASNESGCFVFPPLNAIAQEMGLDKAVNVALQVVIHYAHDPLSNIFYGLAAE